MSALGNIDAVSRPMVDPQFANALTNRLYVTKKPALQSPDPNEDMLLRPPVAQPIKPRLKNQCLGYDYHASHIRDVLSESRQWHESEL